MPPGQPKGGDVGDGTTNCLASTAAASDCSPVHMSSTLDTDVREKSRSAENFQKSTWGCSWDSIFVEWMTMVSSCKFTSISWDSRTSKYGKTCPLITGTATQKA